MALTIGCSEGRLSSKLAEGTLTLKEIEALGPAAIAELGDALVDTYSQRDPKAKLREELRQARAHLDRALDLFSDVA